MIASHDMVKVDDEGEEDGLARFNPAWESEHFATVNEVDMHRAAKVANVDDNPV